jgi:hypothetical protein
MKKYNPNPKHEAPGTRGRKGSRLDLSPQQASELLNDPRNCFTIPGKKQLVGVMGGKIYVFQPDGADGYHAYAVSGNEVFTKYTAVAKRIADLIGTDIKRLSRMDD